MNAADISDRLADRIRELVLGLLPNGRRDGREWRAGSVKGEAGSSLAVHLSGPKSGIWHDFATDESGDALDLVAAVLCYSTREALTWSRRWLGLESGILALPPRHSTQKPEPEPDPDRWRHPWQAARPIAGTSAETYLAVRRLRFDDPAGRALRFAGRRARKSPSHELEYHPALLCALSNARSGEQCGIINIYLKPDGSDRLRDSKGKTVTGRGAGVVRVVMLSYFDEPTIGLVLCEGIETGIALFQREMRPIWACGGTGTLAKFPVLGGIEALTIAADADVPGQRAADQLAERWRDFGREVLTIVPPVGDWADA